MLSGDKSGLGVLTLDWYYSEAGYDNSLHVFTVDDADAAIDGVAASDSETYHGKATSNSVKSLSRPLPEPGEESPPSTNQTSHVFEIGDYYSFYVGQNSGEHPHIWFPFFEGNVDEYDHFSGSNVEDLCQTPDVCSNPGGYALDTDHNDVMYTAVEKLLVKIDVDVDSDNDSGSGAPARSSAEESIEEDSPGKVLAVGIGQRKPAVIEAEVGEDFSADDFTFTITYADSTIRLYDSADVETGVFIPSGTTFTSESAITKDELLATATIYMDGIALGGCDITLTASKVSGAHSGKSISDKARVTVALDLDTDSDNDGTIESTENYNGAGTAEDMIEDDELYFGKIINLNRDDDNNNQDEDYNDDHSDYDGDDYKDNDFALIELVFSGLTNGDLNGYELHLSCDAGLNLWADETKVTLADSANPPDSSGDEWYVWEIDASLPSFPATLYVEGVSTGSHNVYWRLSKGSSPIVASDTVEFTVVTYVSLETVAFTGTGLDGIEMQDHYQDKDGNNLRAGGEAAGNNDISVAPEWVGDNVDVTSPAWLDDGLDADSDPERNKHALIPKDTRFKGTAVFDIPDQTSNPTGITAWAICSDSNLALASELSPVTLERINGKWQGTFQIATAPTSIGILEDFKWTWFISIDNEIFNIVNNSTHTVFVCKEAFTGYKPYDWVAWMSSAWVDAASPDPTTDAQIVEAIGTKASDDDATEPIVGVDFDYVVLTEQIAPGDLTKRLLQDEEGNCFSFAYFMKDLCRVQNIVVGIHSVHSVLDINGQGNTTPTGWYDLWATSESDRDGDNGPGWDGGTPTAFVGDWVLATHAYFVYGGRVYDPAMGKTFTATDGDIPDWQEYFLDLMTRYIDIPTNPTPQDWPFPSTNDPADETVWVRYAIDNVLQGDDWTELP